MKRTQTSIEEAGVQTRSVSARHEGLAATRQDALAVEEPLEIRLAGVSLAVTMRTPGHDYDLVRGFLITEGIVPSQEAIASVAHCPDESGEESENIVNVNLWDERLLDPDRWKRNFFAASSCGICGKAAIDSIRLEIEDVRSTTQVPLETIYSLEPKLQLSQSSFNRTGGLHAAGLFSFDGELMATREDIGRHNAVDKVIGYALDHQLDLENSIMVVSGRASFEIVQKALKARIAILAAVSAPSTLAVDLAASAGMTLIGFLRSGPGGNRCNVYTGAQRLR